MKATETLFSGTNLVSLNVLENGAHSAIVQGCDATGDERVAKLANKNIFSITPHHFKPDSLARNRSFGVATNNTAVFATFGTAVNTLFWHKSTISYLVVSKNCIAMKLFLLVLTIFVSSFSFAQNTIKLEDAAKHVGDSVTVCGKVAGGIFLEQMENSPTFLSLGAAYPDQLLSLVIWKDQRGQYEPAPETQYMDKEVCATGKIVITRERPQIVIYQKSQLKLASK